MSKKKEFVFSKQLLRSGASVGANVREAESAESKLDFIHKMSISQKKSMKVFIGSNYYLKQDL